MTRQESDEGVVPRESVHGWRLAGRPERKPEPGSEGSRDMCGKQKMDESYPAKARTESPESKGAPSISTLDSEGRVTYDNLIETLLSMDNIEDALKQVVSNGGAPGVDGMTVYELRDRLPELLDSLRESIRAGKYKPKPVRRVEIPKPDGGVRNLGIPTVMDRLVQQMLAQVMEPIFEPTFSDSSFGFRPGRSAHDAIMRVVELYDEGYTVAVSIDLRKYFDTIPQDLLMTLIRRTIRDLDFTGLIKKFLKSGVAMPDGLMVRTEEGTPQGGPLSPLLANIYLDQFDKELERRGLMFVRYADDCVIYVRSERAAQRVMESCSDYLEKKLKLTVNREKSSIGSPMELKYLGFKLVKLSDGSTWAMPHEKSIERFKQRIRVMTKRHRGVKTDVVIGELRRYMRGWFAYFGIGPGRWFFEFLEGWVRRRIRAFLLTQWKTPKNIQRKLKTIGNVSYEGQSWKSIKTVSYRKHRWRASKSPIIHRILNNANLQRITGMYYMTDDWTKVQARFPRSPLRNRTVGSEGGRQTTLCEYA